MASGDVQLLTHWASPFSMRVDVALSLKGVTYSKLPQDFVNKSPLLLQSNPVYKMIPVLLHDAKPVCDSLIIVQYVDEAFPSPDGLDLLPKDPYCKAIARFWADFVDKKIFDKLFVLGRKTGDEQEAAETEIKVNLKEAFGTVAKEPPYFGGPKSNYVDVILSPLVACHEAFEILGNFKFKWEKLPRLAAWMRAVGEGPWGQILPEPSKVTEFYSMMAQRNREAAQAQAKAQT